MASGDFLEAAELASELLVSLQNPKRPQVLSLFYIRIVCLELLGLRFEAAHEAEVLDLNEERHEGLWRDCTSQQHVAPWELRALAVRLRAIAGGSWKDAILEYQALTAELRVLQFKALPEEKGLWQRRADDIVIRAACASMELGDVAGATRLINTQCPGQTSEPLTRIRTAILFLRLGDIAAALRSVSIEHDDQLLEKERTFATMFQAVRCLSVADFDKALDAFDEIRASENWRLLNSGLKAALSQNIAVCYVYTGRVQKVWNYSSSPKQQLLKLY